MSSSTPRLSLFGDVMTVYIAGPCGQEDNYSYIIVDNATKVCAITDPSECFTDVCETLEENGWIPTHVLTTHHHWDHAGANQRMVDTYPNIEVVGGNEDEVEACTKRVNHGDSIRLSETIEILCLNTPGHTDGHTCYLVTAAGAEVEAVFTGDCMFVGGCGRCLEGTYELLFKDLTETLGKLKPETRVFVGHEYTVNNLKFGLQEDPNNAELAARLAWAKQIRCDKKNGLTVPTTMGEEWSTNIFLRCCDPAFQMAHKDLNLLVSTEGGKAEAAFDLFSILRKRKDGNMKITTDMLKSMPGMVPGRLRKAPKV